ncbi:hypothetical protein BH18ACT4_BH18ACT4_10900 [soil metagenome]
MDDRNAFLTVGPIGSVGASRPQSQDRSAPNRKWLLGVAATPMIGIEMPAATPDHRTRRLPEISP